MKFEVIFHHTLLGTNWSVHFSSFEDMCDCIRDVLYGEYDFITVEILKDLS